VSSPLGLTLSWVIGMLANEEMAMASQQNAKLKAAVLVLETAIIWSRVGEASSEVAVEVVLEHFGDVQNTAFIARLRAKGGAYA
jgi:formylmethanofuran:tetrahydromethanopterin formyltransferase